MIDWEDFAMSKNMSVDQLMANSHYMPALKAEMAQYARGQQRKENKMDKTPTFTIKKRQNAPDFVFGGFGCKLTDLKPYVNDKGYINFDILSGKEGGYYVKVSDYGIKNVTKNDTQGDVLEFDEISF